MHTRTAVFVLVLAGALLTPAAAPADMAPPMAPPGSTLLPGDESTAVRMLAETVTLSVEAKSGDPAGTIARTDAIFTMRNLGHADESMAARFPLSFPDGSSDGYFNYPEIPSISVKIDGHNVSARREMQPPIEGSGYRERDEVPWAVFDVAFPMDRDVTVEVSYTAEAYGYYPQAILEYVLETGAGWYDTIGSADIIVRLPYEATPANILVEETNSISPSTPDGVLVGNEIRWHFEDLEPASADNIQAVLVAPGLWQAAMRDRELVSHNAGDGEAWGRLAKAYKEAARLPKGWLRDDSAGSDLLSMSREAYEKCLSLLPKDPLWHFGYADLLWSEYYWTVRSSGKPDTEGLLPRALTELQTTMRLDPQNRQAIDMLDWIEAEVPAAVQHRDAGYDFLALTATPLPPTPFEVPASPTPALEPTIRPTATRLAAETTPESRAVNPLCGATGLAGLLLPIAALVGWRRKHD